MNVTKIGPLAAMAAFILSASLFWFPVNGQAQSATSANSRPEEIEWTWEVRPSHPDSKLPNVLLVGDSITRNYFPEVQRQLSGVANVYLFATSASIGDPRVAHQLAEFTAMEAIRFTVVHFNNGMHGWSYTEAEYRQGFSAFLASIRAVDRDASFVWASTTPVKTDDAKGATNDRVNARNAIALSFIQAAGIPLDDQHALMMQHLDDYQGTVHFNDAGAQIQGRQAAASIRKLLR